MRLKIYGPSMADFISQWAGKDRSGGILLTEGERLDAYLKACEAAPGASKATRRKWKRRLGL